MVFFVIGLPSAATNSAIYNKEDYYKIIMKGYIAKLISDICLKVNDEDYKKYLNIYQKTLDKGYEKNIFINMSLISQETYTIGYFHHAYLYC